MTDSTSRLDTLAPDHKIVVGAVYDARLRPGVNLAVTEYGGLNVSGLPYYRVVWGWKAGEWLAGQWITRYVDNERWYIERWMPPEFYGTEREWNEKAMQLVKGELVDTLGPFPRRGGYEWVGTFEAWKTHEPMNMTYDLIHDVIVRDKIGLAAPADVIHSAARARREKKQNAVAAIYDGIMDDNIAAFPLRRWMPVSGPMTSPDRRRETYSD